VNIIADTFRGKRLSPFFFPRRVRPGFCALLLEVSQGKRNTAVVSCERSRVNDWFLGFAMASSMSGTSHAADWASRPHLPPLESTRRVPASPARSVRQSGRRPWTRPGICLGAPSGSGISPAAAPIRTPPVGRLSNAATTKSALRRGKTARPGSPASAAPGIEFHRRRRFFYPGACRRWHESDSAACLDQIPFSGTAPEFSSGAPQFLARLVLPLAKPDFYG
jgi:hypothetical protein